MPIRYEFIFANGGFRLLIDVRMMLVIGMAWACITAIVTGILLVWRGSARCGSDGVATCGHCGYATRGLSAMKCPECGVDLREAGIKPPKQVRKPSRGLLIAVWALLSPIPLWWTAICIAEYGSPRLVPAGLPVSRYVHPWWFVTLALACCISVWIAGVIIISKRSILKTSH